MVTMPSPSTPTVTGEVWSPPPCRRVTSTARWLSATKDRASSGFTGPPSSSTRLARLHPCGLLRCDLDAQQPEGDLDGRADPEGEQDGTDPGRAAQQHADDQHGRLDDRPNGAANSHRPATSRTQAIGLRAFRRVEAVAVGGDMSTPQLLRVARAAGAAGGGGRRVGRYRRGMPISWVTASPVGLSATRELSQSPAPSWLVWALGRTVQSLAPGTPNRTAACGTSSA